MNFAKILRTPFLKEYHPFLKEYQRLLKEGVELGHGVKVGAEPRNSENQDLVPSSKFKSGTREPLEV